MIAYHEAGHTLVAKMIPGTDPIHKVSVIPRGAALGVTQQLPIDDRHLQSKQHAENLICILMGGRLAEELIFNQQTTGAGDDINKATELSRRMVCEWGMSDLGPLNFGNPEHEIFLGRDFSQQKLYSEKTAVAIDHEITKIIQKNYSHAKNILETHLDKLNALAKNLLEFETLDGDQIDKILKGEKLPPPAPPRRPPPRRQEQEVAQEVPKGDKANMPLTPHPGKA